MKIILILILSFLLQGCAFLDYFKKHDEPVIAVQPANIDSATYELCDLLSESLVINTFEDGLIAYGDLATKYSKCAKKQSNSVVLLKKFANKP
jgi:PBP1b-binding outer membrane lipoprotein LpoB